jgi:hypothetical protein
MTTGSGVAYASHIRVSRIAALGEEKVGFPVVCYTLPPAAAIDGLLGLDFLRGRRLAIDFREGLIELD